MIRALRFLASTSPQDRVDAFQGWRWLVFVPVLVVLFAAAVPANACGTALSPPQAVLPVPASIAFAVNG